jgi:hypothetical protein
MKFIEKTAFFMILGPSIEPEKPSVKSASTPYPPQKVVFIAILLKIYRLNGSGNNSRPNLVLFTLLYLVLGIFLLWEKPNSFSVLSVGFVSSAERKFLAI